MPFLDTLRKKIAKPPSKTAKVPQPSREERTGTDLTERTKSTSPAKAKARPREKASAAPQREKKPKTPRILGVEAQRKAFRTLRALHTSEKATALGTGVKYVFRVNPRANSREIREAVEEVYSVHVKDVHMITIPRKTKTWRGQGGFTAGYKKAIVTLAAGQTIEVASK